MAIKNDIKGMTLVELLIVLAVITIGLAYIIGAFAFYLSILSTEKNVTYANSLVQQSLEGVRNIRHNTEWDTDGLATFSTGISYHLEQAGSPPHWILVSGSQAANGFKQEIVFDNVYRDLNDNVVASGGVIDPDSKKVSVSVSWNQKSKVRQIEVETILTNWNN